jgi:hypothetical protein
MVRARLLLLLVAGLSACAFGPRAERQPLAREPRGANVTLQTPTQSLRAELLGVQDTALLLVSERERITLVPYRVIREARVELNPPLSSHGRPPSRAQREALRRVSRYPQGVGPELLRALLAAYSQSELEVVRQ